MLWALLPNMIKMLLAGLPEDHGGEVVVIMVSRYLGLTDLHFSKHKNMCVWTFFISIHYFISVHVFKLLPER